MSTPFPLEEQAQQDTGAHTWDPWEKPAQPGLFQGLGPVDGDYLDIGAFHQLASAGLSAAAKGELLLSGAIRSVGAGYEAGGNVRPVGAELPSIAAHMEADAKERLRALTPDPATNGAAVQAIHGLGEIGGTAAAGFALGGPVGAFSAVSTTQGYSAYKELLDQGVDPSTARKLAVTRGALSGAGVVTPMVFGASLIPRLATGIASNVGFGVVNRATDSSILRSNGYDAMADQEAVFDRTQILVDAVLGAGFGGLAHLAAPAREAIRNTPELQDAALTANLALRDRRSGPGVPVTPADAQAHAAALEKAVNDLQDGKPVNVAGTGIEDAQMIQRGGEPNPQAADLIRSSLKDSGLLEEHEKLQQLEDILTNKLEGKSLKAPDETDQHIASLPEGARTKLVDMYREAADAKPGFDEKVRQLAEGLDAESITPGLKGTRRAVEKVVGDLDGDASQIRDLLRATLVAPTGAKMVEAAQAVRDHFEVVHESNRVENPGADGYRDVMFKVRTANGHIAEVQINLPAMTKAKEVAHDLYAARDRIERKARMERRDLTERQAARVDELNAQMRAIYDPAWADATKASKSSSETGIPLRETESGGNQRGPEDLSNARNPLPPSGFGISATGTPSTSHSLEPRGNVPEAPLRATEAPPTKESIAGEGKAEAEENPLESGARQAIAEQPDLKIPLGDDKSTNAADALATADGNLARVTKDAGTMFKAAIDCFLRRGAA